MSSLVAGQDRRWANPYLVKDVQFPSGERMPLLLLRSTGMAIEAPTFWLVSERRPLGIQANTLQQELRNLLMLYLWADARGFDLLARIQSAAFLRLSELNDLDRFCRQRVEQAVAEACGSGRSQSNISPLASGRVVSARPVRAAFPGRMQVRHRMATIHGFMDHVTGDHLSRLTPGTDAYRVYAASRSEMLDEWEARYRSLDVPHDPNPRKGLEGLALERLKEVIHPNHPDNPWAESVRERNGLIVLMLWSLGIRRGELLALLTSDLKLTADRAFLSIVRRPNNPLDQRKSKPSVKTRGRELVIEPALATMLRTYILGERRTNAAARKHPFVFVSSANGAPLTLSSLNKLFEAFRRVSGLPADLSPHVMRHTWNDAFSEASDRASPARTDVEKTKEERMRSYLMGWSANSAMAARYSRRWNEEAANKRLLELQKKIVHSEDKARETKT